MSATIPQDILDALTDVAMPRLADEEAGEGNRRGARASRLPVHRCRGAGARQRRRGLAGGGRIEAARRRRRRRQPERLRRHVGLLRLRQADPAHRQRRRARRRLPGDGRRARRGRRDGRGHRLCRGGGLAARAVVPAVHGAADPAGPARRRAALPDRPRRGRARDELRTPHVASDGAGAGEGSDPADVPIFNHTTGVRLLVDPGARAALRRGARDVAQAPRRRQSVRARRVLCATRS